MINHTNAIANPSVDTDMSVVFKCIFIAYTYSQIPFLILKSDWMNRVVKTLIYTHQ